MSKKEEKHNSILQAAEDIFGRQGFPNTHMSQIAESAGVAKGTVYFYFNSKENLYMALAHRGMSQLNDQLYQAVHEHRTQAGIASVLAIVETYMQFGKSHPLYSEAILEYMALVRGNAKGLDTQRTSKAMQESIYFKKLRDIHNIPLNLVTQEIARGRKDGSILNTSPASILYMTAWALILGFMKISKTSPPGRTTLFSVPLEDWRNFILNTIERLLMTPT